jgi:hypothetical protein
MGGVGVGGERERITLCEMNFSEKTCLLLEAAVVFNTTYQIVKVKGHAAE